MLSNEPKLCKPRELARNRQVLNGRSHSRPQTRAMAPQKRGSRKIPLFDPFLSARRSETMRLNEPKLFNTRDLARKLKDLNSERLASILAPTGWPQKRAPEYWQNS